MYQGQRDLYGELILRFVPKEEIAGALNNREKVLTLLGEYEAKGDSAILGRIDESRIGGTLALFGVYAGGEVYEKLLRFNAMDEQYTIDSDEEAELLRTFLRPVGGYSLSPYVTRDAYWLTTVLNDWMEERYPEECFKAEILRYNREDLCYIWRNWGNRIFAALDNLAASRVFYEYICFGSPEEVPNLITTENTFDLDAADFRMSRAGASTRENLSAILDYYERREGRAQQRGTRVITPLELAIVSQYLRYGDTARGNSLEALMREMESRTLQESISYLSNTVTEGNVRDLLDMVEQGFLGTGEYQSLFESYLNERWEAIEEDRDNDNDNDPEDDSDEGRIQRNMRQRAETMRQRFRERATPTLKEIDAVEGGMMACLSLDAQRFKAANHAIAENVPGVLTTNYSTFPLLVEKGGENPFNALNKIYANLKRVLNESPMSSFNVMDGSFDPQDFCFRIGAGKFLWMDEEKKVMEISGSLNMYRALSNVDQCIRIMSWSNLGLIHRTHYGARENLWYLDINSKCSTISGQNGCLGAVIVIPDSVWKVMVPLLKMGIFMVPTALNDKLLENVTVDGITKTPAWPAWNGRPGHRCYGDFRAHDNSPRAKWAQNLQRGFLSAEQMATGKVLFYIASARICHAISHYALKDISPDMRQDLAMAILSDVNVTHIGHQCYDPNRQRGTVSWWTPTEIPFSGWWWIQKGEYPLWTVEVEPGNLKKIFLDTVKYLTESGLGAYHWSLEDALVLNTTVSKISGRKINMGTTVDWNKRLTWFQMWERHYKADKEGVASDGMIYPRGDANDSMLTGTVFKQMCDAVYPVLAELHMEQPPMVPAEAKVEVNLGTSTEVSAQVVAAD